MKRSHYSGDGVCYYTSGVAHVDVHFPENKVCCANCVPFCRYEEAFRRYSCRATGEQILTPFSTVGQLCPIEFAKPEENDKIEEDLPWH